ncbi:MAG: ABC transporter permease [Deltaproteobacteria bacterium]|nr:ABC transporter permease [Deltaproteobacteria bacterium]
MGQAHKLLYASSRAFKNMREGLGTSFLSALTVGFCLAIPGFFLVVFVNLSAVVSSWGERTHIVAYLDDGADATRTRAAVAAIMGVLEIKYISSADALNQLKQELKDHGHILEGVDQNPLPASFEIMVAAEHRAPEKVSEIVRRLKAIKGLDDVVYSMQWLDTFSALIRMIEVLAFFVGVFLLVSAMFIITNTIRLSVYSRADEIEVMRLMGSSEGFIRIPFYIASSLEGVLGGLFAFFLVTGALGILFDRMPGQFSFLVAAPRPLFSVFLLSVAAGAVMGVAGCLASLARFLRP